MLCENQQGFVIHLRNYSDSKKLVSLFTLESGHITSVFRVTKRTSPPKPFALLDLTWQGNHQLKTLRLAETLSPPTNLYGRSLYCGLYINEVIMRLVPNSQSMPNLFSCYQETIAKLISVADDPKLQEVLLRRFEFQLLLDLGLGVDLAHDAYGEAIAVKEKIFYRYVPERGFCLVGGEYHGRSTFSGLELHDIAAENWNENSLRAAKHLSRIVFSPLLGGKPIKSRELFT